MKKIVAVVAVCFCIIQSIKAQNDVSGPMVQQPVYFDVSPPLRDMVKDLPVLSERSWKDGIVKNIFNIRQKPDTPLPGGLSDPGLQDTDGMSATAATIANFDGNNNTQGYTPPDTHGDVGPNHYFQVVNCHYSIYSKTGTLLLGPLNNSSVFNGLPNNSNNGDAVVLYDEQAGRWLFSQFSLPNYPAGPFYQMIAVSATNDPTGSWYRYQYTFANMPDYPKFGVWGDAYYMSIHQFTATSFNWAGCAAVAFDRTLMLAGSPAATMVTFSKPSSDEAFGWLPSDCDGPFPTGTPPNYFLYTYDGGINDHIGIYEFHVDWNNTANSTFGNFLSLPVNAFTTNITGITQQGSTVKLDVLNDRMMYRLQYRKFSDHEAMVCNHTVDYTSALAGIRWYELRKTTGAWSVYQQSTYAPNDNLNRWMGSIAMDSSGNIALGYSVSGSALYPSIRYTGRKKNDVLNAMTITESEIIAGGGAQTEATYHRWGDYSAMSCDPSAANTFWFTTEYYSSTSSTSWKTRIASFRFAMPPTVVTNTVATLTPTAATLSGSICPNGLATTYAFQWGTTAAYGNTTTVTSAGSGLTNLSVSAALSGLTTGTTYHYRLTGTNSDGTVNGSDVTFTPGLAVVSTAPVSAVTGYTAVSGGSIALDGGSAVTARGVCWSVSAAPTIAGSHTSDGTGTGSFVSSLTGLAANTLYHVRAYATNGQGTIYGEELTFTTLCVVVNAFPWTEGFENGGSLPGCWTQEQVSASGLNWSFIAGNGTGYPAAAHGGTYNACLSDATTADNITRLISPPINLAGISNPTLTFWHTQAAWAGRQDQLLVYYRTSQLGSWTLLATYTASITAWTQRTLTLPNGSASYYICFEGNAKYGRGVCIDDVEVTCTPVPAGVTVAASANPVCQGAGVTFTATPVNGGTAPACQWRVNGSDVGGATNATYSYIPANGDAVTCQVTSSSACVTGNPALSNTVTMTVNPTGAISVSVTASQNPSCDGSPVLFTAVPVNGGTPAYQWYRNGAAIATGATYSCYPADGDQVKVVMTSSLVCGTGNPATSNLITMSVVPQVTASLNIMASTNMVDEGNPVTFTAYPGNGGPNPQFQWKVNGSNAGSGGTSFTYVPVNGDEVTCVMTSDAPCVLGNPVTSNAITIEVNPIVIPTVIGLQNVTVTGTQCFNALQTINVAGSNTWFKVVPGGTVTLIAGTNIMFNPGTLVQEGGYLYGYISPGGPWCGVVPMVSTLLTAGSDMKEQAAGEIRIYPNPTAGEFTLELPAALAGSAVSAVLYDARGSVLQTIDTKGFEKTHVSITRYPSGLYLFRVSAGSTVAGFHVVKTR